MKYTKIYKDFDEIFNRILINKPFDKKLKPYSKNLLHSILEFFEKEEEYEKCKIIKDFIEYRFNHQKGYLNNS